MVLTNRLADLSFSRNGLVPGIRFILAQLFEVAVQAQAIVATNQIVAGWAAPDFSLRGQEFFQSCRLDLAEIVNHAHVVPRLIARIQ